MTQLTHFVWKPKTANGYQELPLDYTNWGEGEPNNGQSVTEVREACLLLWPSNQHVWFDGGCELVVCYVCEYEL